MHRAAGGVLTKPKGRDRGGDEQDGGNGGDGVKGNRCPARQGVVVNEGREPFPDQGPDDPMLTAHTGILVGAVEPWAGSFGFPT